MELYNGEGAPQTYVKKFQTLCSDFPHDPRLMEKLFTHTFRDKALQWYCSFPPQSIHSLEQLANTFVQHFQSNIGPQITLTNLMHCKQEVQEKVAAFIGRYKHLHSQIAYHVFDGGVQRMFINMLQKDIRDELLFFLF